MTLIATAAEIGRQNGVGGRGRIDAAGQRNGEKDMTSRGMGHRKRRGSITTKERGEGIEGRARGRTMSPKQDGGRGAGRGLGMESHEVKESVQALRQSAGSIEEPRAILGGVACPVLL